MKALECWSQLRKTNQSQGFYKIKHFLEGKISAEKAETPRIPKDNQNNKLTGHLGCSTIKGKERPIETMATVGEVISFRQMHLLVNVSL